METIHGTSPYADFDASDYTLDLMGWGQHSPVFDALIEETKPGLIIEVGTWLGASAIKMAKKLDELGLDCPVLCIDTWLGAAFHWEDPESRKYLGLKNGYPTLYYQFLANVALSSQQERIIPLPLASTAAFRWLKNLNVTADLIYIDADHEAEAVYTDINSYWTLKSPDGVVFGDDYDPGWPGVVKAVQLMSENHGIDLQTYDEKWILGLNKQIKRV